MAVGWREGLGQILMRQNQQDGDWLDLRAKEEGIGGS